MGTIWKPEWMGRAVCGLPKSQPLLVWDALSLLQCRRWPAQLLQSGYTIQAVLSKIPRNPNHMRTRMFRTAHHAKFFEVLQDAQLGRAVHFDGVRDEAGRRPWEGLRDHE
eukprot:9497893-Pyramimonas_sp.AAC.1